MYKDEFKDRYTTIAFAIDKTDCKDEIKEIITHQHQEIELIAITEGSAEFYIDSQKYLIHKGDILIVPPYSLHRVRTSSIGVNTYYCICFNLSLLCDDALRIGLEEQTLQIRQFISGSPSYSSQLQSYIINAFSACEKNDAGWELEAIGNISLLFSRLKKEGDILPTSRNKKELNFGRNMMRYIIDHYSTPITSQDAANAFFMNHSSFCRAFKKNFGCCFTEYLLFSIFFKSSIFLIFFPFTQKNR